MELMDDALRNKILACLYRDRNFCMSAAEYLKPSHFSEDPVEQNMSKLAIDYWRKFKSLPTDFVFVDLVKKLVEDKKIRKEDTPLYATFYGNMKRTDISDSDYVTKSVVTFVKKQEYKKLIEDSVVKHLPKNNFEEIEKEMKRIFSISDQLDNAPYSYFGDEEIDARAERRVRSLSGVEVGIPTGIKKIDDILPYNGFFKKELYNFMGGPKTGKCVRRDTMIFTSDGLCEIGDYVPVDMAPDSYAVKNIDVVAVNGIEESSHIYNNGFGKTKKITLIGGQEIEGTPEHPILVRTKYGEIWKKLSDISIGDWIVCKRGYYVFGSESKVDFDNDLFCKDINYNLVRFISTLLSYGKIEGNKLIISCKNKIVIDEYLYLLSRCCSIESSYSFNRGSYYVSVSSPIVLSYLNALDVDLDNIKIPKSILRANKNIVSIFLRHFISDNCEVAKNIVKAQFKSEKIVKQMQILLLNYGVRSDVFKDKKYHLWISDPESIVIFKSQIGLYDLEKDSVLNDSIYNAKSEYIIPYAEESLDNIMKTLAANHKVSHYFTLPECGTIQRIINGKRTLTEDIFFKIYYKLSGVIDCPGMDDFKNIINNGLFYLPINKIEESECETVDLTMPKTHSFIANGIVSHNTFSLLFFANFAARAGYNVAYFSGETSIDILSDRLDAMNSEIETKKIAHKYKEASCAVRSCRPARGDVYFYEYKTKSLTCSEIERQVRKLQQSTNDRVDMIISDYTGTMRPERIYGDKLAEEASIYEDLRGLGYTFDCPILTASQINRGGAGKAVVTGADKAGTYEAIMVADYNITFAASAEDLRKSQLTIHFAECRNVERITIKISTAYEIGKFYKGFITELE